jgi:hypothetical protein
MERRAGINRPPAYRKRRRRRKSTDNIKNGARKSNCVVDERCLE